MIAPTACRCGLPIVQGHRPRNPRRWCSEACRVWHHNHPGETRSPHRTCDRCAAPLGPHDRRWCSKACGEADRAERAAARALQATRCATCGRDLVVRHAPGRRFCDKLCRDAAPSTSADRQRWARRQERMRRASRWEPIELAVVVERDGGICHLCGGPVEGEWPSPSSPSRDHIVPLIDGGDHTYANVRLAHLGCNSRRGNTPLAEYLASVGG